MELAAKVSDWTEIPRLAHRHQIQVLVEDALRRILPVQMSPDSVRKVLAVAAMRRRLSTLGKIALTRQIATSFTEADIPVVQLKGPALSQRLYGDCMLRVSVDIDLLVPWKLLRRAVALLQGMGYQQRQPLPAVTGWSGLLVRNAYHDCLMVQQASQVPLELHWRPGAFSERIGAEMLNRGCAEPEFGPGAPPQDLEMVDLLVHGTNHYWVLLKWLSDIQQAALLRPSAYWEQLASLAGELKALPALRTTALLVHWIYGMRVQTLAAWAAQATRWEVHAAQYALRRLLRPRVLHTGMAGSLAKTCYRLVSCTPYQITATALRCLPVVGKRTYYNGLATKLGSRPVNGAYQPIPPSG